jgi:hypothetical protein
MPASRLVQLRSASGERRVATVAGDELILLEGVSHVYGLALEALRRGVELAQLASELAANERCGYAEAYRNGRLLAPFDHPDPAHLTVSGTGLTHVGSASARDKMHKSLNAPDPSRLTDSLRMFRLGVEQGKPADGGPGAQPEWFYKGNGHVVVAPGQPLSVPEFSRDAGEEAEIVGLYIVAADGTPWRIGFALGNELSDHITERENYLYLAHSKLRPCSFGPELLLGELPHTLRGSVRVLRAGQVLWQKEFASGEGNMSHRLSGLEHHHFKYPQFRVPGEAHVHFFGADVLSFADGVRAEVGDVFEIECSELGMPLRNPLAQQAAPAPRVRPL